MQGSFNLVGTDFTEWNAEAELAMRTAIFNALSPTSPWLTLDMVQIPSAVWNPTAGADPDPNDARRRRLLAVGRLLFRR